MMYAVGSTLSIGAVELFIASQWNFIQKPKVFLHNESYFVVRFINVAEKEEVLCKGPYTMFSKPVIIKPWSPEFSFKKEVLRTIPFWVKLPDLPLNCWTSVALSKIGSGLGNPLCADTCTSNMELLSYTMLQLK